MRLTFADILAKIETHIYMCNILRSQKESDSFLKVTFVSILCFSHENPAKSKSDNTIIFTKLGQKNSSFHVGYRNIAEHP